MDTRKTLTTAFAASGMALLLASCGGGGGGDVPPGTPQSAIPPAAQQDPTAAFNFVASVAARQDDRAEPLFLGDATLATSDTDEPKAVR